MTEIWINCKKEVQEDLAGVQRMINRNYEEIQETVTEFLDEAVLFEDLREPLTRLKEERDHLFTVKEDLETKISHYDDLIQSAGQEG